MEDNEKNRRGERKRRNKKERLHKMTRRAGMWRGELKTVSSSRKTVRFCFIVSSS